jgi:alpha-glucosidase
VLEAMLQVMRFWLDKGVDGFRVDVIEFMSKDEQLRDDPVNPDWDGVEPYQRLLHVYSRDLPDVHKLIQTMRRVMDAYPGRVLIGEVFLFEQALAAYYGENNDECHLPFNFRLIYQGWDADTLRRSVEAYEAALPEGAWRNWVLGNHDQHRTASRVGAMQARVACMLLLTLRGTPTCYYGDEIGMEDVPIPSHKVHDPAAVNQPEIAHISGRDPERTPMQ